MASIKKEHGQSTKGQRVYMINAFEQQGKMTGYNVSLALANDVPKTGEEARLAPNAGVQTAPCLSYDKYVDPKTNEEKPTFKVGYSKEQYEAMVAAANKDGDNLVFIADLMPRKNGPGYMVNTNTLKSTDIPFDKEAHKERTNAAREANKAKYAAKEADASVEASVEDSAELDV